MLPVVKERLVKFAATKGLKPYLFAEKNLLSSNTFANTSEIKTESLVKVFTNYPELNFDWVITGRGEMLVTKAAAVCDNCSQLEKKYQQLQEKYLAVTEKAMQLQEEQLQYIKQQKK